MSGVLHGLFAAGGAVPFSATGGDQVYTTGLYKVHKFTSSGNFVIKASPQTRVVNVLLVGGGGAGGRNAAAGGGGGGEVVATSFTMGGYTSDRSHAVVVGAGGIGRSAVALSDMNGGNSSFVWDAVNGFSYTVLGGGAGGITEGSVQNGRDGGCGGGGSGVASPNVGQLAAGTGGQPRFGSPGGNGFSGGGGGGGGGMGYQSGADGYVYGGSGGIGRLSDIDGVSRRYGGGGGGGMSTMNDYPNWNIGPGGAGGDGGGGQGGGVGMDAADGQANTGGGGGGGGKAAWVYGGNGGSGIVIIRYLI